MCVLINHACSSWQYTRLDRADAVDAPIFDDLMFTVGTVVGWMLFWLGIKEHFFCCFVVVCVQNPRKGHCQFFGNSPFDRWNHQFQSMQCPSGHSRSLQPCLGPRSSHLVGRWLGATSPRTCGALKWMATGGQNFQYPNRMGWWMFILKSTNKQSPPGL